MKQLFLKSLFITSILSFSQLSFGQIDPNAAGYFIDALRFSQTSFGGTARFMGIGGANTSLGGDITSAHSNPAGLGFNRSSLLSISPSLGFNNSSSTLFKNQFDSSNPTSEIGEEIFDSRLNLGVNHLGVIISKTIDDDSKFHGGSFGISLTRIKDFNQSITYEGTETTSIIDYFLDRTDGLVDWEDLDSQESQYGGLIDLSALAYFTYIINPGVNGNDYYSFIPQDEMKIKEQIITKGAQYEWNFSYGANYNDFLYFGASLGVQTIRYDEEKNYTEDVIDDLGKPLQNILLKELLAINGIGVNFQAGLILRVNDYVRFGVSAKSPTYFRLEESSQSELIATYNNFQYRETDYIEGGDPTLRVLGIESAETLINEGEYNLTTPGRINTGVSIFIGKKGFISADIEYLGYDQIKLGGNIPTDIIDAENITIENIYNSVINYKIGGEYRFGDYRIRGGFAYYNSPYKSRSFDDAQKFFTLGAGKRKQNLYTDFSIIINQYKSIQTPFTFVDGSQPYTSITDNIRTRAVFSLGTYF